MGAVELQVGLVAAGAVKLHFDFAGGTNFDPEKDEHIHPATIVFLDDDRVETSWVGYQGGEEAGTLTLALAREPGEK